MARPHSSQRLQAPNREERDRPESAENRCGETAWGAWAPPVTFLARGGQKGGPRRPDRSWSRWDSLVSSTAQMKTTMTAGAAVAGVSSASYLEVSRVRAGVLPEAFFVSPYRLLCGFSTTRFFTSSGNASRRGLLRVGSVQEYSRQGETSRDAVGGLGGRLQGRRAFNSTIWCSSFKRMHRVLSKITISGA